VDENKGIILQKKRKKGVEQMVAPRLGNHENSID
jgi:hypothetical protein